MTMNPLPPQAYTKDTLTKAYNWLLHQSPSIREMAATPDILVSLYLKAQRSGEDSLERPSIQNFKNELKNLAGLMGELDHRPSGSSNSGSGSGTSSGPLNTAPVAAAAAPQTVNGPVSTNAAGAVHASHGVSAAGASTATFAPSVAPSSPSPAMLTAELLHQLDPKSRAMIAEVKEHLNLGQDVEVLRLLISLGYHKAKTLYS